MNRQGSSVPNSLNGGECNDKKFKGEIVFNRRAGNSCEETYWLLKIYMELYACGADQTERKR